MKLKLLASLFLAVVLLMGSVVLAKPQTISDVNKVVSVSAHQAAFTIKLPSNPTTGYSWVLQDNYNSDLIKPLSHRYLPPDKKLIGASGLSEWTFEVKKDALIVPTKITLTLNYMRSWEIAVSKTQRITIITVT